MKEEISRALKEDRTIDIITIGAKSGLPRRIEIWFTNVNGRIIICGTPDAKGGAGERTPRDWLANLKANSEVTLGRRHLSRYQSGVNTLATIGDSAHDFNHEVNPNP